MPHTRHRSAKVKAQMFPSELFWRKLTCDEHVAQADMNKDGPLGEKAAVSGAEFKSSTPLYNRRARVCASGAQTRYYSLPNEFGYVPSSGMFSVRPHALQCTASGS